ncbi:MAG: FAD-binding oxidoreductase, partial [Rickettsiales bacterium]
MGPSLDGLFSQSNFGIVTKMTIWLMPIPQNFQLLFYKIKDQSNLPKLIDVLQYLSIQGLVRPTITIYNDFRIISSLKQYPWNKCSPEINSSDSVMKLLKEDVGINNIIGSWNGEISIRSANSQHGKIQYEIIKQAIEPYVDDITLVE